MDYISIIKWNNDVSKAPTTEYLLIIYKDDTGDYTNYYTQVAWRIANSNIWVSDDDQICTANIMCWANFPQYEDRIEVK